MPDNMYSARASHVSALVVMFVLPLIVFYWLTSVSQRVLDPYLVRSDQYCKPSSSSHIKYRMNSSTLVRLRLIVLASCSNGMIK